MADTTLTPTNLVQPEVGASADSWGTKLNAALAIINGWFDTGPALKVANGGTGATTAAGARTNLSFLTAASDFGAASTATPQVKTTAGTNITATAAVRYKQIGKWVIVSITITPDGSGDGTYRVALPVALNASAGADLTGRNTLTGKQLQGPSVNTAEIFIKNYDDSAPGVTAGGVLRLSGVYEAA